MMANKEEQLREAEVNLKHWEETYDRYKEEWMSQIEDPYQREIWIGFFKVLDNNGDVIAFLEEYYDDVV